MTKCIIRAKSAGIFYASIKRREGDEADLENARRIHYWEGATECIGIATDGVGPGSRLTVSIPEMTVLGVIEVIPCSEKAVKILDAIPEWRAS